MLQGSEWRGGDALGRIRVAEPRIVTGEGETDVGVAHEADAAGVLDDAPTGAEPRQPLNAAVVLPWHVGLARAAWARRLCHGDRGATR